MNANTLNKIKKIKERLKVLYSPSPDSDEPHCYIQLALVKDGEIGTNDEKLNEITKLTLQGHVDEIAKIKEPLNGVRDIFCYKDTTCPRILLVIGAPGELHIHMYYCIYVGSLYVSQALFVPSL